MTQLSDVLSVGTPAAKLQALLASFVAKGLNANGWQAKRIAYVMAQTEADASSTYEQLIFNITLGGYLPTAFDSTGTCIPATLSPWLDLLGYGWFNEFRNAPLTGIIQLQLSDTTGAGPYTLSNPVAVAYPSSSTPLYYRSQAGTVTVPRNGSAPAVFVAEAPGAVYNVGVGQITDLATPIPGVGVTSPQIGTSGVITIQSGADTETDQAYAARLQDKWGLLSQGYTVARIMALTNQCLAGRTLRQVVLDPGPIPGVPFTYIADTGGPISYADALKVYQYLADITRKPVGNWPVQAYPALVMSKSFAWTLYVDGTNPNAQTAVEERLQLYYESVQPGAKIHLSKVIDVAINDGADGVIGFVPTTWNITGGADYIQLPSGTIFEATDSYSVVGP